MHRNIALYPWFKFVQQLLFWQATWFLYFESQVSAAGAILLYVIGDLATTVLEVPSGYMSDRLGRRVTLLMAGVSGLAGAVLLVVGEGFAQFALANALLGAGWAFASGTDSSMLYESLKAEGRTGEIEAAELRAWRFSFSGLALSAIVGGALAQLDERLPYVATAIAAGVFLVIIAMFREPPHVRLENHRDNLAAIRASLGHPTLRWLLCLTLVMYVFSHIPFVFGQPLIREALAGAGYAAQAPLVSGSVTFLMMVISVLVSLVALPLRKWLGLQRVLLLAFGMQVLLTGVLAISNSLFVMALLMLRMVPESLSQPFVRARIQPLLPDGIRATYFSVQSLAGRLLFAVTLGFAAAESPDGTAMPYADMQVILGAYAVFGSVVLVALGISAHRARV